MEGSRQLHNLAAVAIGKVLPVPIEYEAGWVPEKFWALEKRKISCLVPRIQPQFLSPNP
jgi:hypothetical protein